MPLDRALGEMVVDGQSYPNASAWNGAMDAKATSTAASMLPGKTKPPSTSSISLVPELLPIVHRESGGKPFVGYTPPGKPLVDLSKAPLDATGFPIWEGNIDPTTGRRSHAAGIAQIQPGTWRPIARKLGIRDFSVESQIAVANELYRQEGGKPWAASAGGSGATHKMPGGMGPRPPVEDAAAVAPSRLSRAMAPAPEAPGTPIQLAPAAAPAVATPVAAPLALPPAPQMQAPSLPSAYTDALAAILGGRRRPMGSMFG